MNEGHLARARRIVGFLTKFKHAALRHRAKCPDCSHLKPQACDWDATPHGDIHEETPADAPEPLGLPAITTSWVDANLCHDFITGRAVTGTVHAVNQTIIDSHSKKQNTVETSTCGSEFVAARTATDQIIDLRLTFDVSEHPSAVRQCLVTMNPLSRVAPYLTPN